MMSIETYHIIVEKRCWIFLYHFLDKKYWLQKHAFKLNFVERLIISDRKMTESGARIIRRRELKIWQGGGRKNKSSILESTQKDQIACNLQN